MSISFPVDLVSYFAAVGGLRVRSNAFNLSDPRTYNETQGGEGLVTSFGTRLWYGEVTVTPLHNALMRPLEARCRYLQRADARFFIGDLMADPLPMTPPSTFTLQNVQSSSGRVRFTVPTSIPGLTIPVGTKFSFDFAGRRALHELLEPITNPTPTWTSFRENVPPVQPGWEVDTPVSWGPDAKCLAIMLPDTLQLAASGPTATEGFTFSWRQTLGLI